MIRGASIWIPRVVYFDSLFFWLEKSKAESSFTLAKMSPNFICANRSEPVVQSSFIISKKNNVRGRKKKESFSIVQLKKNGSNADLPSIDDT